MDSGNEIMIFLFLVAVSSAALAIGWVLTQAIRGISQAFAERNSLRREVIIKKDAYEKSGQRMLDAQEEVKKERERMKAMRWAFNAEKEELETQIVDLTVELAQKDKIISVLNAQLDRNKAAVTTAEKE